MSVESDEEFYSYHWFRHTDGSMFICCKSGGEWFMPGVGVAITDLDMKRSATLLGPVPRSVIGGGSIDQ